jgi:N6-L-threonylcarbamoyladenine synthase
MPKQTTILALETSCDETAAAVLRGNLTAKHPTFAFLSSVVKSQIATHKKTGGVVPEVAARAHLQHILPVTNKALADAGLTLKHIDYVAITTGPGLIVSLIVGTEFAKALAMGANKPLLPTNHMAGHLYSAFTGNGKSPAFPLLALIVSGGHTMLVLMKDEAHFKTIGHTVDDAAGEAFDKVARLLGLPYPGGPEISKIAKLGKTDHNFPRPMLHDKNFNFSFSGLKTAVGVFLQKHPTTTKQAKADIALSFEQAAVDVLVQKTLRAAKKYGAKSITLSGGVAANKRLRETLTTAASEAGIHFSVPEFELCTDNAKMIAIAAYFSLRHGKKAMLPSKVKADSNWEIA